MLLTAQQLRCGDKIDFDGRIRTVVQVGPAEAGRDFKIDFEDGRSFSVLGSDKIAVGRPAS